MKGFLHFFFLFVLVTLTSEGSAQSDDYETKVDSLKEAIAIEKIDTTKFRLYQQLNKHVARVDRSAATKTLKDQLKLAEKIGDLKMIAKSHSPLGSNYLYLGEAESAFPHISKAVEINRQLEDIEAVSNDLNNLAAIYQHRSQYEEAAQTYQEVIAHSESLNDKVGIVYSLINLMALSTEQDDEKKALEYANQIEGIIKLFPEMEQKDVKEIQGLLSAIYFNVGLCYNRLNAVDSARHFFEKALIDLQYIDDDYTKSTYRGYIDNGLGEAFRMNGEQKKADGKSLELIEGDFRKALEFYKRSNESFTELKDQRGMAFTLVNKGNALKELGYNSSAEKSLIEALSLSQKIGFKEEERDSYERLAQNAEMIGDYQSSVEYYKQYFSAHETIRNEERDKAQKELETKYEIAKKSIELEEERSANLENQAKLLENEAKLTRQKYLLWLGVLIFGGIAYGIFARQRFKKRQEVRKYEQDMNKAMSRFIPTGFINALGREKITDVKLGDQIEKGVTVVFTDIRSFTTISEGMTPQENFAFVREYAERMGPIIERNGGFISQYLGDGIMAIFQDNPASALMACLQMQEDIDKYNTILESRGIKPIKVGMGMHTGPLVMGIIGDDLRWDATLISDTVNTASRIESTTKEYESDILLSQDTASQIKDIEDYNLNPIGELTVKGKTIPIEIYECTSYKKQRKSNIARAVS